MGIYDRRPELDDRDRGIIARRLAAFDQELDIRIGDYVDFADGVTRRVSHVYPREWGDDYGVQTSDGGSFYLDKGHISFSGLLQGPVPRATLTLTEQRRPGRIWIFHHDWQEAGNGVDDEIPFRVYHCSEEALDWP